MSDVLITVIQSAISAFEGVQKETAFGAIRIKEGRVQLSFEFQEQRLAVLELDPVNIVEAIVDKMNEDASIKSPGVAMALLNQ